MKKSPRIVMIVQARMGSTRLPGKHLKQILGKPLIFYLIERLRRSKEADEIVLATTTNPLDDPLIAFCHKANLSYFRGSEEDVLDRYLQAAKQFQADVIVRISGDCPLIDPHVVDCVIEYFLQNPCDYAANTIHRTYPRGMDTEVFSFKSLELAAAAAQKPEEREHVTPYYYFHPELFKLGSVEKEEDDSRYRWTVDTEDDFKLIKTILDEIYPRKPDFNLSDLLKLLKQHPDWMTINAHVKQKSLDE